MWRYVVIVPDGMSHVMTAYVTRQSVNISDQRRYSRSTTTPGGPNVSHTIIRLIAIFDGQDQFARQQIGQIWSALWPGPGHFISISKLCSTSLWPEHKLRPGLDQWGVSLVSYLTWGVKTPLISTNQRAAFLTAQVLQVAWSLFTFTPAPANQKVKLFRSNQKIIWLIVISFAFFQSVQKSERLQTFFSISGKIFFNFLIS